MVAICSTIGDWLKAGLDKAASALKWIWETVSSLFSKACDLTRDFLQPLWSYYNNNNHRERTWTETESSRVEVLELNTSL